MRGRSVRAVLLPGSVRAVELVELLDAAGEAWGRGRDR
jgi:hypothetical protein